MGYHSNLNIIKRNCIVSFMCLSMLVIWTSSKAIAVEPYQSSSEQQAQNVDTTKESAISRAMVVPAQMKFDLSKYYSIVIDKDSPAEIKNDSDIRPFLPPVVYEADWWAVLFVPQNIKLGPPICVYLDKHLNVVRGYIIGPPMKQNTSNEQPK